MAWPVAAGLLRRRAGVVRAVDDVSFFVRRGETLGLVGESGCGKSTVARSIVRLVRPDAGRILFRSRALGGAEGVVDLLRLSEAELFHVRREVQLIFQDPTASLNPRLRVRESLREPFRIQRRDLPLREVDARIAELAGTVGLSPAVLERFPHELSGGQRQRVGIARALALHPQLVIADEPVSALDVSVQGQVLNLFADLQERFALTYLFIAHDLAVIRHISDRVAVMYLGKIVEVAPCDALFRRPAHPYTEALLAAALVPDPDRRRPRVVLAGPPPSPLDPPGGCRFHPRCPYARAPERRRRCAGETPPLVPIGGGHFVACHFAGELTLRGVAAVRPRFESRRVAPRPTSGDESRPGSRGQMRPPGELQPALAAAARPETRTARRAPPRGGRTVNEHRSR